MQLFGPSDSAAAPNWPESNTCSDTSNMSKRVLKQRTRINRITRITTGMRKGATCISGSTRITTGMSKRVLKQRTRTNRITRITTGVRKGATCISGSTTGVVTELLVFLQVLLQY